MSNVGKRGKLKLETRLRAALLNGTNTRLEHHEIERVIQALSKPQAREGAQPVAWMMRERDGHMWAYSCDAEDARLAQADGFQCRPLYTTPPAPEAERMRSVLADLVSWFTKPVRGERGLVWVIPAGQQGADDAVAAAIAGLQQEGRDRG